MWGLPGIADWDAGLSSADQVVGLLPSLCVLNPKRPVFWFDQKTPIFPCSLVTEQMSSLEIPVATVIAALHVLYGESLHQTKISFTASAATHILPVPSTVRVADSTPVGKDTLVGA